MAIDTTNEKLAIMEFGDYWEPGLPLSPGAFDTGDKQQLLWGYHSIAWVGSVVSAAIDDVYYLIQHWHRRT